MKLFRYEGYNLNISEEALLLKPFRVLWDRDKTKDKTNALMELGYIYFMEDPRSAYQTYVDPEQRAEQIKLGEGIKDKWKPDAKVLEAQKFYASFNSDGALLLEDLRAMVSKLRAHLKIIDLDAVDKKGKPIYSIDSYTKTVTDLNKLIMSIDETEKNINKELTQSDKVRGTVEKSMYEDI